MPLKEALQKYLEEMINQDDALRAKYNPKKMDECCAYVNDEARKYLKSKNGAIEDSIVFKWARDFFIEDVKVQIQKEEKKETVQEKPKIQAVQQMSKKAEKEKEAGQLFFDF